MTEKYICCQLCGSHDIVQKELPRLSSVQLKLCLTLDMGRWGWSVWMLKKQLWADKEENKAVIHSTKKKKKMSKVRKEKEGKTALLSWAFRLYNASDGIYFPCLQITRVCVLLLPISFYCHECTWWDNRGSWQCTGGSLKTANKRSIASRFLTGRGK